MNLILFPLLFKIYSSEDYNKYVYINYKLTNVETTDFIANSLYVKYYSYVSQKSHFNHVKINDPTTMKDRKVWLIVNKRRSFGVSI